jgi:hypothetical protein
LIVQSIIIDGNTRIDTHPLRSKRLLQRKTYEQHKGRHRRMSHHDSSITAGKEDGQIQEYDVDKLRGSVDNRTHILEGRSVRDKTRTNRWPPWIGPIVLCLVTSGCKPDDSPFRAENEALKKQVTKQESLLSSLQDGNKVMQQQIDLLNQELRDAKKATESAKVETKHLTDQLEIQLAQTKRMSAEVQRTAAAQAAQNLKIDEKGAQFDTLPRPLGSVTKVVEEALARNGYQLKVSIKTDQKAVYVTERKVSNPASLEVAGFRNQYLISLQALPANVTKLGVKAEFEKVAQGGRILSVSAEETAEIERRLIGEISKALESSSKT